MPRVLVNPFRYGREVDTLVDREADVAAVVQVATSAGTLFLLGPRRFGKTSVLKVAGQKASAQGVIVLRYDAEAYETVDLLAKELVAGAARAFATTLERAGDVARRFFGGLRPSASYDLTDQKLTVDFGLTMEQRRRPVPVLTEVLDGIERLAAKHRRPTAVILDEFQEVVAEGGERAEKQIRAAVQTHRHVAYVFAGSKTRLLADMTANAARAFWKLGDRRFLGPIPRADFRPFVRRGLESAGVAVEDGGVERILDVSEDVPYNVQWLSSKCWEALRIGSAKAVTVPMVDGVLEQLLDEDHAVYMQTWVNLTMAQRRTLKAVVSEVRLGLGEDFHLTDTARLTGLAPSSMQRTLSALENRSLIRQEATATGMRWRLDDPFFAHWLTRVQAAG